MPWRGKRDAHLASEPLKSKGFLFLSMQEKTQLRTCYLGVSRAKNGTVPNLFCLDFKARHRLVQCSCHLRQLLTGCVGMSGTQHDLLGQDTNAHQIAIHLTRHQGLLLRGTGDQQVAFIDLRDRPGDLFQCLAASCVERKSEMIPPISNWSVQSVFLLIGLANIFLCV